jgi:hypothetical protein
MRVVSAGGFALGAIAMAVAGVLSCLDVAEPTSSIPVNACAQAACTNYALGDASAPAMCGEGGACEVSGATNRLVLVVTLPSDAPVDPSHALAPSAQYVIPYDHLQDSADTICTWPGCTVLPAVLHEHGGYLVSGPLQEPMAIFPNGIDFFLGNADPTGLPLQTLLPATATYRLVSDPWMTQVAAIGLPVQPVVAAQTVDDTAFAPPGPSNGPSFSYDTFLPPGTYERTVVPAPGFDAIFGPAINVIDTLSLTSKTQAFVSIGAFDLTSEQPITPDQPAAMRVPVFTVSRQDGLPLDQWTAYLRDATTGRTVSNVVTLAGTSLTFQLRTLHEQPTDPLTNVVLVVQPPSESLLPTGVFVNTGNSELPTAETYPALPPPIRVAGDVRDPAGFPVDADLEFEGLAFSNGATLSYIHFEFTATASARVSPGGGSSNYAVTLPQGEYRVTIRPVDDGDSDSEGGIAPALQVTTLLVNDRNTLMPFPLYAPHPIAGRVLAADKRPMVGATVEALPVRCDVPALLAETDAGPALKPIGDTPACLPRPQQTVVTDPKGYFSLPTDPGGYQIRVRPATGTGFPWVTQPLVPSSVGTVQVDVPVPFHASFRILDANDVPVDRALVKAFLAPEGSLTPDASPPPSSPAVELGETLTDGSGQCDLYLALPP